VLERAGARRQDGRQWNGAARDPYASSRRDDRQPVRIDRLEPPFDPEPARPSEPLDDRVPPAIEGHLGIERADDREAEAAVPGLPGHALGIPERVHPQRGRHVPAGVREQESLAGQHAQRRVEPPMAPPDAVHRADEEDIGGRVAMEEQASERLGERVVPPGDDRIERRAHLRRFHQEPPSSSRSAASIVG
jgi:hypothetical protein